MTHSSKFAQFSILFIVLMGMALGAASLSQINAPSAVAAIIALTSTIFGLAVVSYFRV